MVTDEQLEVAFEETRIAYEKANEKLGKAHSLEARTMHLGLAQMFEQYPGLTLVEVEVEYSYDDEGAYFPVPAYSFAEKDVPGHAEAIEQYGELEYVADDFLHQFSTEAIAIVFGEGGELDRASALKAVSDA